MLKLIIERNKMNCNPFFFCCSSLKYLKNLPFKLKCIKVIERRQGDEKNKSASLKF